MESLKKKSLIGLFWSIIDSYGSYFIRFGFSIAIARFLYPEDYGLIGMLAIFIALANMLRDSGLQDALIQKKDANTVDYSSVFYFNIIISLCFYLLFFFSANVIADFFNEPRLVIITKIACLAIFIPAFGSIHQTYFIKNLNFKVIAKINFITTIISSSIGLALAIKGFGVWALVYQSLSGDIIRTILNWIFNKWHPGIYFSKNSISKLLSFGWKILLQRFSHTLITNIYYPIIGKQFPVAVLGNYTRAKKFQDLVVQQATITLNKILFPVFSSIQHEKERFRLYSMKAFRLELFILYPVVTLFIVTAKPFVILLLTERWLPIVPYMQLLYLEGFILPFYLFNLNIVNSLGRSDISLIVDIVKKVLLVISIFIGIKFGVTGLIIGQIISSAISLILSSYVCGKRINYAFKEQFNDILPIMVISGIIFIIGWGFLKFIDVHSALLILIQSGAGIIIYYTFVKLFQLKSYMEFRDLISPHIPMKFKKLV